MNIADMRREYAGEPLSERDVDPNPVAQFEKWFDQATRGGMTDANAMTLATATRDGRPSARIVLLKGIDERGFVFFTDYRSRKGGDLDSNPQASLCFFWEALHRQVRVSGSVMRVTREESEAYFHSRPHGSQIGAWASHQSSSLSSRDVLENEVARLAKLYPTEVPPPPHWGGYRLTPDTLEFWQGRPSRLHDRIEYTREGPGWRIRRLSP
jgi:pyridoxamine 5'-phosphate oxidase